MPWIQRRVVPGRTLAHFGPANLGRAGPAWRTLHPYSNQILHYWFSTCLLLWSGGCGFDLFFGVNNTSSQWQIVLFLFISHCFAPTVSIYFLLACLGKKKFGGHSRQTNQFGDCADGCRVAQITRHPSPPSFYSLSLSLKSMGPFFFFRWDGRCWTCPTAPIRTIVWGWCQPNFCSYVSLKRHHL